MDRRAAAPRVLALAAVAAGHAGALLMLLAMTRAHPLSATPDVSPILVMLLPPIMVRHAEPRMIARSPRSAPRTEHATPESGSPSPRVELAPDSSAIDWMAAAHNEADREVERNEQHVRQARALAPASNGAFAPTRPRTPEFGWDYAATHRIEAVRGGATLIHLGDHCVLALFLVIPMGFGCAVGKIPARDDLFEHLHDPADAPEPTGH